VNRSEHHHAARWNLRHGRMVRLPSAPRGARSSSRYRSSDELESDRIAEGGGEVLLGGRGAHPGANRDGHRHRALRRGGRRLVWCQASRLAALQPHPHLAYPNGPFLDRHSLAGGRVVYRTAGQRDRTERPEIRRECPVSGAVRGGGRIAYRRVAQHPGQAVGRHLFPLGPPRIRVHRSRPRLAVPAVRGAAALALPGSARRKTRAQERQQRAAPVVVGLHHVRRGHRPVIRGGAELGTSYSPVDRRILALVGGPPLGGRLLRSVCHGGDRFLLHPPEPDSAGSGGQVGAAVGNHLPGRRATSGRSTSS